MLPLASLLSGGGEEGGERRSKRSLVRERKSYAEIPSDDEDAMDQEEEYENAMDISGQSLSEMSIEEKKNSGHMIRRDWLLRTKPTTSLLEPLL